MLRLSPLSHTEHATHFLKGPLPGPFIMVHVFEGYMLKNARLSPKDVP